MSIRYYYFILFLLLFYSTTKAQNIDSLKTKDIQFVKINNSLEYGYKKPTTWNLFQYVPKDIVQFGKFSIQKENLKWDAIALGSTLALLPFDQKIMSHVGNFGHRMGNWDKDARFGKVAGLLTIIPKNIPSAVYYVGNGGTTLLLSGMFYVVGKIGKDNYRALNTSNELVESLFSVGILDQTIKRISGRETPIQQTQSGGEWDPFPSFIAFQSHTPQYDSMPSGHMSTFIATVTIIATNYPEYKWITPVGYSLASVLAFNMLSGKVHWASDYPIAFFMEYVMGKNIANRRIIKQEKIVDLDIKKTVFRTNYNFNRYNNTNLLGATITF